MSIFKLRKERGGYKVGQKPIREILENLEDGRYLVTIEKLHPKRSIDQNKRLWGYIYPQLLYHINEAGGNTFRSVHDLHFYFTQMRVAGQFVDPLTGEVVLLPASTQQMSTDQMSLYMEVLENIASEIYHAKIQYYED